MAVTWNSTSTPRNRESEKLRREHFRKACLSHLPNVRAGTAEHDRAKEFTHGETVGPSDRSAVEGGDMGAQSIGFLGLFTWQHFFRKVW